MRKCKAEKMNEDKIYTNVKVAMSRSEDDWKAVRECFVKSFHRYPLYKYMVPDESTREAFLRAYLDANYDVTVGSGEGILVVIRVQDNDIDMDLNKESETYDVVGGVLFVPPSSDGIGWAIGNDEPYWNAYDKYGLGRISKEGLERVKRYESWENERVAQKACATRMPLWNGLFCSISPDYASKGVGSRAYRECIHIMAQHSMKRQKEILTATRCRKEASNEEIEENNNVLSKLKKFLSPKQAHYFTLLSHRFLPHGDMLQKLEQGSFKKPEHEPSKELPNIPQPPLLVAISQSERAVHFHKSNGFQVVSRIPYYDPVDDITPFYSHVLVLDPFRTGRSNDFVLLMEKAGCSNVTGNQHLMKTLRPNSKLSH